MFLRQNQNEPGNSPKTAINLKKIRTHAIEIIIAPTVEKRKASTSKIRMSTTTIANKVVSSTHLALCLKKNILLVCLNYCLTEVV
jgi:hypothetical protein